MRELLVTAIVGQRSPDLRGNSPPPPPAPRPHPAAAETRAKVDAAARLHPAPERPAHAVRHRVVRVARVVRQLLGHVREALVVDDVEHHVGVAARQLERLAHVPGDLVEAQLADADGDLTIWWLCVVSRVRPDSKNPYRVARVDDPSDARSVRRAQLPRSDADRRRDVDELLRLFKGLRVQHGMDETKFTVHGLLAGCTFGEGNETLWAPASPKSPTVESFEHSR